MEPTVPQPLVYSLSCSCHPDAGVRYVGQTRRGLPLRLSEHRRLSRYGSTLPVHKWCRKHGEENIVAEVLEHVADGESLDEREIHWVRSLLSSGAKLMNVTSGGNGAPGIKLSPELRLQISKRMTGDSNPVRKLSIAKAQECADMLSAGMSISQVAKIVGVSPSCVYDVSVGKSWLGTDISKIIKVGRKLNQNQVVSIIEKLNSGVPGYLVAKEFGVSASLVADIRNGKSWSSIDRPAMKRPIRKLTEESVLKIVDRINSGHRLIDIAIDYGVSDTLIARIKNGKAWGSITGL